MKPNGSRGWLTGAALSFAAAGAGLAWITKVDGHYPLPRVLGRQPLRSDDFERTLVVAVMMRDSRPPNSNVFVNYQTQYFEDVGMDRSESSPIVTISLPPSGGSRILLSDILRSDGYSPCSLSEGGPRILNVNRVRRDDIPGAGGPIRTVVFDPPFRNFRNKPLNLIELGPSDRSFYLICRIRDLTRGASFTDRSLRIRYLMAGDILLEQVGRSRMSIRYPGVWPATQPLIPASSLSLSFDVRDAGELHFRGGEPWSGPDPEISRVLRPSDAVSITWTNRWLQQWRDVMLVIIGTLVGVGATMLTEAFRAKIQGGKE